MVIKSDDTKVKSPIPQFLAISNIDAKINKTKVKQQKEEQKEKSNLNLWLFKSKRRKESFAANFVLDGNVKFPSKK